MNLPYLDERCTIYRPTETTNAEMVRVAVFAVLATDVPCSIQSRGQSIRQLAQGEKLSGQFAGYFDIGINIVERDAVEMTSGPHAGKKFRVQGRWSPNNNHHETSLGQTDENFV